MSFSVHERTDWLLKNAGFLSSFWFGEKEGILRAFVAVPPSTLPAFVSSGTLFFFFSFRSTHPSDASTAAHTFFYIFSISNHITMSGKGNLAAASPFFVITLTNTHGISQRKVIRAREPLKHDGSGGKPNALRALRNKARTRRDGVKKTAFKRRVSSLSKINRQLVRSAMVRARSEKGNLLVGEQICAIPQVNHFIPTLSPCFSFNDSLDSIRAGAADLGIDPFGTNFEGNEQLLPSSPLGGHRDAKLPSAHFQNIESNWIKQEMDFGLDAYGSNNESIGTMDTCRQSLSSQVQCDTEERKKGSLFDNTWQHTASSLDINPYGTHLCSNTYFS